MIDGLNKFTNDICVILNTKIYSVDLEIRVVSIPTLKKFNVLRCVYGGGDLLADKGNCLHKFDL